MLEQPNTDNSRCLDNLAGEAALPFLSCRNSHGDQVIEERICPPSGKAQPPRANPTMELMPSAKKVNGSLKFFPLYMVEKHGNIILFV